MKATPKMPLLFLGHGNPMNAIGENGFVEGFREIAKTIPKPTSIVCISAHWETDGTYVTAMKQPPTIHDFGGFPKALFDVQYPAPGNPELAKKIRALSNNQIQLDLTWGLDHGTWSVIKHLYPEVDVPIVQISLDYNKSVRQHYNTIKSLASLRHEGVLIVGSGNLVHNLQLVAWDKLNQDTYFYDWAEATNKLIKEEILAKNHEQLMNHPTDGNPFKLSIPTPEHYLPLLYVLALQEEDEPIEFFNDKIIGGSLSMTSLKIG
ncbi:MAG: 4,5-DOPA dioxygenase extradiol [Bacteroidales bacterium]|nr:4,5-DOPA dioxygenase extradiol [Bacteroidales bacterium]